MANSNYVPRNDVQFLDWAKNLFIYAVNNRERWNVLDPTNMLQELIDDFETKLNQASTPNSGRVDVMVKNEARKNAERAIRTYVQGFLARNPFVNLEDRATMKIPIRDTTLTTVPPPSTPVTGRLSFPAIGLVEMREIRAAGEKTPDDRSKHGVRIYFGIVGDLAEGKRFRIAQRPKTGDDLPHSVFTRQQRCRFDFTGENGREVFFCMRYENAKGQAGPWGKMISAFVP